MAMGMVFLCVGLMMLCAVLDQWNPDPGYALIQFLLGMFAVTFFIIRGSP